MVIYSCPLGRLGFYPATLAEISSVRDGFQNDGFGALQESDSDKETQARSNTCEENCEKDFHDLY